MLRKIIASLGVGIGGVLIVTGILMLTGSTNHRASALTGKEQSKFAQNNILFYNDECVPSGNSALNSGGGINIAGDGFKIDGNTDPHDLWYAEGCLNNGECTVPVAYGDGGVYLSTNPFLFSATKVDMDFGGLQYIYAENYDIEYENTWPPKFTEKTGPKSNRKYYWIVLPADAYTNGLGETYVAKFEKISEPVYFITFDAHACEHQSEKYCDQAKADPDNVLIGKEFLGAFTHDGGNYTPIANLAGKLTYFHRIAGRGEVLVHESASGGGFALAGAGSSADSSSGSDSSNNSGSSSSGSSSSGSSSTYSGDDSSGGSCSLSTVEIPSYNQCSGDWANYPYNYAAGKTICSGGCGPSSMAMLVTVLTGQTVYPNDIVDLTTSAGQYPNSDVGYELTQIVADKYNLETQKITYSSKQDAYDKIKKYLNDGYVVHLSGSGSHPGFSNSNTSGHYIGLVSIDSDDKVRVANSNAIGNNTTDLQNIVDAIHNGSFVILKNKGGAACSGGSGGGNSGGIIDPCDDGSGGISGGSGDSSGGDYGSDSSATTECGKKALASAKKIIDIANQYGFDYNQGSHDLSGQFDEILKGRYFETDCTGFASFVMYDAFGVKEVFWTGSIASNSNYKEVSKSEVQVGDIFNYNYGCTAHGGIITKIENGKITEIAQTGRPEYLTSGTSSKNGRLGYSYYPNLDNGNLNCVNSASDVKYYRYKECK